MSAQIVAFRARDPWSAQVCKLSANVARMQAERADEIEARRKEFTAAAHEVADELARLDPRQLRERLARITSPTSIQPIAGRPSGSVTGRGWEGADPDPRSIRRSPAPSLFPTGDECA
jgi:hypothetical protein